MRSGARRAVLAAILALAAGGAQAERLVLSLSNERVAISSNFNGTQVTLFGVVERDGQSVARADGYDLAVTVRGPREAVTVRRKDPVGPVWLNREQQKFVGVPTLLGVYATRPIGQMASAAQQQRYRIGVDAIVGSPDLSLAREDADASFRAALVRLKSREGLYVERPTGVVFITDSTFQARILLPANAPLGDYDIEAVLLAGGALLTRQVVAFRVEKAGFEETITGLARDRAWLYGIGTALLALGLGWFASVVFRRD